MRSACSAACACAALDGRLCTAAGAATAAACAQLPRCQLGQQRPALKVCYVAQHAQALAGGGLRR